MLPCSPWMRSESPPSRSTLAVIAMGKCGAQELNYISDVDVVFIAEPRTPEVDQDAALKVGQQIARRLMQIANAATEEGSIWEVDAALRPEGKAGALVQTVDSYVAYYRKWAKTWEFQALLKGASRGGDLELGRRYVDAVSDFRLDGGRPRFDNFVDDVQAMRRKVESTSQAGGWEIKLGGVACATSSSRCSCCNWSTAAAT